jgi:CheY-like chemotaxis protein
MSKNEDTLVLVADDEPSMLALLSAYIRSKGYRVLEASDGDMAWQLAHEHLPNAVVLDVMMPGMSGWEVCKKIRESVSLAHTGVVMLTGIGESLNELTSPLYGADAYIDKPFEFAELESKIKETLERRRDGALGRPDDGAEEDEDDSDDDEDEDEVASDDDEDDDDDDDDEAAAGDDDGEEEDDEPVTRSFSRGSGKKAPKKVGKKAPAAVDDDEDEDEDADLEDTDDVIEQAQEEVRASKKSKKKAGKKAAGKKAAGKKASKVAKKASKKASKKVGKKAAGKKAAGKKASKKTAKKAGKKKKR